MKLVELQTERLWLREWTEADISLIHEMLANPIVEPFHTLPSPLPFETVKKTLSSALLDQGNTPRTNYGWSIFSKANNQFVGEIGLDGAPERFRSAELFYTIAPTFWRKGIATEAGMAVAKFVFEELKFHRLEAGVETTNSGSIRVLEKIGMRQEGLRRKILPMADGWRDNYLYAMLEEDYFLKNKIKDS